MPNPSSTAVLDPEILRPSREEAQQLKARILEMKVSDEPLFDLTTPTTPTPDDGRRGKGGSDGAANAIERVGPDRPGTSEQPGLMKRIFGRGTSTNNSSGKREQFADRIIDARKPSFLRPFARRDYHRETALGSIRRGFDDLSNLMADIRDGLAHSVDRQTELLDQMRYLPVVAEQNARSAERFEEQFKANNTQLARSNELAGESIKAIHEQIRGQRDQNDQLNRVLGTMSRESRDQKRDVDEMQGRLDRMRQSDQAIADNLGSVAGAIRRVSEQTATQGEVVAKLQATMDERTKRLEEDVRRRASQGWLLVSALLLAFTSLGALAGVGVLYLRQTGVIQ